MKQVRESRSSSLNFGWMQKANQYVVVNGQEMAELESGKVPVSAYESATPRVYNETVKETTDKPKEPSGPSNPGQSGKWSVFPQTNEARTLISLLGILYC